jgi:nucleoside-diphosphate-sugar epimerase
MQSDSSIPLNLGTDVAVKIDELVALVARLACKEVKIRHNHWMPQGVRGRSSDNTLLRHVLRWEPRVSLADGLAPTYAWIAQQVTQRRAGARARPAGPPLAEIRLPERMDHA